VVNPVVLPAWQTKWAVRDVVPGRPLTPR